MGKVLAGLAAFALPLGSFGTPFEGSSSGVFRNALGPAGMVTTGLGSSSFTWGVGSPPSSLTFAGANFSAPAETSFGLGTLTYYNGSITSGTEADSVELAVTLVFTDPDTLAAQAFTFPFQLINTPNGSDPTASSDIVELGLGRQSVFSFGGNDYTLEMAFGDFGGNSFGDADTFRVFEGESATAQLRGTITENITRAPDGGSTLLLLGMAILGVGLGRRVLA